MSKPLTSNALQRRWELLQALAMHDEPEGLQTPATPGDQNRGLNPYIIRRQLLQWLYQLGLPDGSAATSWEELIRDYTTDDPDIPTEIKQLKVLYVVHFHTTRDKYLAMIKECTDDQKGMGIISVSINREPRSLYMQQALSQMYGTVEQPHALSFHTLWIENFLQNELGAALDHCAVAIFGNELISRFLSDNPDDSDESTLKDAAKSGPSLSQSEEKAVLRAFRDLPSELRDAMVALLSALPKRSDAAYH